MREAWQIWRRAHTAAPALATAVVVLVLLNTALLVVGSTLLSRAVGAVASGDRGHGMVTPLVGLVATLVGTALTGALLPPLCLRIERAIVLGQVDDVVGRIALVESSTASGDRTRVLGAVAERIVSMPHSDALRSVAELLRTRCRGLAGVVVVGLLSPVAAVALAGCVVAYGSSFTNFLDDVLADLAGAGPLAIRRAKYVRSLLFDHDIAGELRTFRALPWLLRVFDTQSGAGRAEAFRERQRHARSVIAFSLLCTAALLGFFAWLITRTWTGDLLIAQLTLGIQGALLMLDLGPAGDVAVRFRQVVGVERDLTSADAAPLQPPASSPGETTHTDVVVACRSIRHFYPGAQRPALDIDAIEIRRGERVAVVGRNGAGKSTLFGIVAGFIEPTEGSVHVDAGGVSIALQRAVRYPTTLRENVSLGDDWVDVDHAFAAIGAEAGVASRADELVGDPAMHGTNLSGGQWQRVGLARAFGHANGGVLLLDEPSAVLDPAAEAEFFRTALDEAHGLTVMLSTHHLANTRFADRIVVLDEGQIVEQGSHTDLMHSGGLYAEMFTTQARSYGIEV